MITGRERLQLPLENHNYLRAVVWGLASDPAQALAASQSGRRPVDPAPSNCSKTKSVEFSPISCWG